MSFKRVRFFPLLLLAILFSACSLSARAAGVVSTCDEQHFTDAMRSGGLVTFSGDCTINLTSQIDISVNTTIDGGNHKVIFDRGGSGGIFLVFSSLTLTLNHVTLQNANTSLPGGAILSDGTLIITNSTFSHNHGMDGGAIACSSNTTMTVNASTFDNNSAQHGGAIATTCPATISNSTFYNNTATIEGGALGVGRNMSVVNSTFSNNSAPAGTGGGVNVRSGTLNIKNSILVANTGDNCAGGTINDGGYNLDDANTCGFTATGSLPNNSSAGLGAFSDNGGPANTMALGAGSSAVGVIPPGVNGCATTLIADQRGFPRPGSLNGHCSMGAYEYVRPANHIVANCTNDTEFHDAYLAGGRITFNCGSAPITITLTLVYNINPDSTIIDGTGNKITFSMGDNSFDTGTTSSVLTLNRLAFTGSTGSALGTTVGTLIVTNSTLHNNQGSSVGSAISTNGGTVVVSNSTLSQNTQSDERIPAAIFTNSSNLIVTNSTIVNNSSSSRTGAIGTTSGTIFLQNTLLAGNSGGNCPFHKTPTDGGYNLDDDGTCNFTAAGSLSNNPNVNLGALSDNGGATQTVPLQAGSSAIDAIPLTASGCGLSPDQRASLRPSGPACDIGAYEANEIPVSFNTLPFSETSNLTYSVNGTQYTALQAPFLVVGGLYPIATTDPQFVGVYELAFNTWSDGGAKSHTITVPANPFNYVVNFNFVGYKLTTQVNPAAAGAVNVITPGTNGYYDDGTVVSLSANANAGFVFTGWSGVTSSNGASATVTIHSPTTVTANFSAVYALTTNVSPAGGGSVSASPSPTNGTYTSGTIVNLTAMASSGYVFSSWSGVDSSNGTSASVTMTMARSVTANFVRIYTLTTGVSPSGAGTVTVQTSPNSGSSYTAGTQVTISAAAATGYVFSSWSGSNDIANKNSATTTVTMNANESVTANFVRIYTLTTGVSPSGTGTVTVQTSPNSGSSYTAGTQVGILATPASGYVFSSWSGSNDIANKNSATTTVTMNANESVTANFVAANAATFLPLDTSTHGNWPGVYGGDGYIIANNGSNNLTPSYATVNFPGASTYTWIEAGPTSDLRLPFTTPTSGNRIGSTFYSGSSFNIDLNLTDGQHQVALYLLDLDTTTRNDVITLRNADTQAVLDTRTISNFHNGVWAVWTMSGHVNIQVTNNGGINAVVAGLFFNTLSSTPAPPSVTIYSPTASQTVTGAITLSANVTASAGVQNVQFVLDGTTTLSPLIPGPGATFTYQWNSASVGNGPHTLQVIGTDNLAHSSQSSVTFNVSNGGVPTASAQFMSPADSATRGNWVGKYGTDGFWIANDPSSAPPVYAALNFTGASNWTWNGSTGDPRALLTSPTGSPNARIASTYYSDTNFTVDLNLNDNQPHQVSLYLLDYDDGRSQTIQIVDATNPSVVLDTRSVSGFQNGQYLSWTIQGHVKIRFTCTGGLNAVLSGIFFATMPTGGQQPPAVTVTAPTAGQQVSGVFQLQATATSTGTIASVQFLVDNSPVGSPITQGLNSTYSFNLDTTTLGNGPHMVKAVATDNLNQQTTSGSVSFSISNTAAGGGNTATFVKADTTTAGNWKSVYGSAGEIIANDSNASPSYAVVSVANASLYTWAHTTDPRAPLTAASNTDRIASAFYNSPGFTIDVNITDGNTHSLALYLLDWDDNGRAETITIVDATNPATVLSSRPVSGFSYGIYEVWNITGHVKILVNGQSGPNAIVNGLFFQ